MSKTLFEIDEPKVTAIAPWFGSNRMLAAEVGKELGPLEWAGIVFCGGFSEVRHVQCRSIVCNDLHRDIINLAQVIAIPEGREWLLKEASAMPFHPDVLKSAQERCKKPWPENINAERALWYFVAVWMGRSAKAGTDDEFKGNLSTRWTSTGGDSNTRYRSAIESMEVWGRTLARCNFTTLDFRDFLDKCKDVEGHGIYSDAPFPDDGDGYRHKFTTQDHRDLAGRLSRYAKSRVVIRYYDHPLVRELYPEALWTWRRLKGRDQANTDTKPEVLLTNGPSYAK